MERPVLWELQCTDRKFKQARGGGGGGGGGMAAWHVIFHFNIIMNGIEMVT